MALLSTFSGLLAEGGVFLVLIVALFAGGAIVALERLLAIRSASRVGPRGLVAETVARVERDGAPGALELCRGLPGVVPSTLTKILTEATSGDRPVPIERIRERAENTIALQGICLSKRLDLLATAGNMATLVGLLATVIGLREAIGPRITEGVLPVTSALGAGVSRALIATGFGIAAAIPLLLAQSYLRGCVDSVLSEARAASEDVIDTLVKAWRAEEAARRAAARGRERRGIPQRPRPVVEEPQPQTVGH
jgi:biopolymer transport protein ExbB